MLSLLFPNFQRLLIKILFSRYITEGRLVEAGLVPSYEVNNQINNSKVGHFYKLSSYFTQFLPILRNGIQKFLYFINCTLLNYILCGHLGCSNHSHSHSLYFFCCLFVVMMCVALLLPHRSCLVVWLCFSLSRLVPCVSQWRIGIK
jgi:hypothetical protein